jgi:AcrR family transcriptional regulator
MTEQRHRGRPRSTKARDAILDAAGELVLARGVQDMSMDAVADQAGVSKATIYRWWATKETLVLDALYRDWDTARESSPDTGSLQADLVALLRPWVRRLGARPYGRVIAALLMEAQTDSGFGRQYRERFVEPRRNAARVLFRRAAERGEIAADVPMDLALDLIYGPIYHRLLNRHAALTDRFVKDVVNAALAGAASWNRLPAARRRPTPGRTRA